MSYSFEAKLNLVLPVDLEQFKKNLNLDGANVFSSLPEDNQMLINTFCHQNIRNISWYAKKIKTETKWFFAYNASTFILLLAIPSFIYWATAVDDVNAENLKYLRSKNGILLAVLTSVFAIHKLVTKWVENRKFRSLFHSASVELKNILYALEWEFENTALVVADFKHGPNQEGAVLSSKFEIALKEGITKSREITASETKAYFDALANHGFDIGAALKTSVSTAKSLIGSLKSGKFNPEQVKKQVEEQKTAMTTHANQLDEYKLELDLNRKKLEKLSVQDEILSIKIDELENLDDPSDSEIKKTELLMEKLSKVETEEEEIAFKCTELEIRVRYAESKLRA